MLPCFALVMSYEEEATRMTSITQWEIGNIDKTCKYSLSLTSYFHHLSVTTASTNTQIPNNSERTVKEMDRAS